MIDLEAQGRKKKHKAVASDTVAAEKKEEDLYEVNLCPCPALLFSAQQLTNPSTV